MKKLASYKVLIMRNECVSCGNCIALCPEYFEFDEDDLSHLKNSKRIDENDEIEFDDVNCCLDAALSCPVTCIHVYEDGEEIS